MASRLQKKAAEGLALFEGSSQQKFSPAELAKLAGRDRATVLHLIERGSIEAIKAKRWAPRNGPRYVIYRVAVRTYLEKAAGLRSARTGKLYASAA